MRVIRVQVPVKAAACALSIFAIVLEIVSVLSGQGSTGAGLNMVIDACTDESALTPGRSGWVWWWSGPGLCDGSCGGSVLTPVVEVALNSSLGDGSW